VARQLGRCRQLICGAPAYFAERGRPIAPDDLPAHTCLRSTTSPSEWAFHASPGARAEVATEGAFRADSIEVLRAAAVAGAGIAQLPAFAICDDLREGRLEAVLGDWTLPELGIHAVYPSRRYLPAKVRAFIEFFGSKYQGEAGWADCARIPGSGADRGRTCAGTAPASPNREAAVSAA
jgi:DNA-binding transcriptional LysR family regulator